jgi:hypothetical protein
VRLPNNPFPRPPCHVAWELSVLHRPFLLNKLSGQIAATVSPFSKSIKLPFDLVFADSNASLNVYLSNDDIAKLLVPLLKLRQACCHPQVGSSGLCSLQHNPLSMDEILQVNS